MTYLSEVLGGRDRSGFSNGWKNPPESPLFLLRTFLAAILGAIYAVCGGDI